MSIKRELYIEEATGCAQDAPLPNNEDNACRHAYTPNYDDSYVL